MTTLFDDARAAVIADLADRIIGRTEPYAEGVEVSGQLPGDAPTPYLYVVPNGVTLHVKDLLQRVTVRVVAWQDSDVAAHALAQLAMALLVDAGHKPLTGPDDAVDPESGRPICAFTVRASMLGRRIP